MKASELEDRYGVAASANDARRLARAVKMIFEKVETEFGSHAGYVAAHVMINAIEEHLGKAEKLLGQARFASILIDTMPTAWSPKLKASFVYVLAPRMKDVLDGSPPQCVTHTQFRLVAKFQPAPIEFRERRLRNLLTLEHPPAPRAQLLEFNRESATARRVTRSRERLSPVAQDARLKEKSNGSPLRLGPHARTKINQAPRPTEKCQ
jgi:hypothetical protein